MAALPEVRQLPPRGHRAAVVPLRRARRNRLPYLAAAACLVAAALAGGLAVNARNEADRQRDRSARAEQQAAAVSALMAAPDATFHTTALKGGGSGTVVASKRRGQTAFLYHGLPALSGQRVYELWYSRNGTMEPAGLVETGSSSGTMLLTGGPWGADGVGITAEPPGGSSRPTTPPLAVLRV